MVIYNFIISWKIFDCYSISHLSFQHWLHPLKISKFVATLKSRIPGVLQYLHKMGTAYTATESHIWSGTRNHMTSECILFFAQPMTKTLSHDTDFEVGCFDQWDISMCNTNCDLKRMCSFEACPLSLCLKTWNQHANEPELASTLRNYLE